MNDWKDNPAAPAIRADLAQLHNDLLEAIYDSKTEILRAFYGFTETVGLRFKDHDNLESRVGILEQRILEVEKRLNLPPAG